MKKTKVLNNKCNPQEHAEALKQANGLPKARRIAAFCLAAVKPMKDMPHTAQNSVQTVEEIKALDNYWTHVLGILNGKK